jgi:hypothetical protein
VKYVFTRLPKTIFFNLEALLNSTFEGITIERKVIFNYVKQNLILNSHRNAIESLCLVLT